MQKKKRRFLEGSTSVHNLTLQMIFSNDELHIILKRKYVVICKHSSFFNWRNCLLNQTWSSERNK